MANEPKRLFPTFYVHPELGPVCETKIGPEAGADTTIERLNESHARLHPEEYARFAASGGLVKPTGMSLKRIPGVDDTIVSVLAVHGITDVEKFARMGDVEAAALMPNASARAIDLRDTARLLIDATKPASDIEAMADELTKARAERDAALQKAAEAAAAAEALSARARPEPKVAQAR